MSDPDNERSFESTLTTLLTTHLLTTRKTFGYPAPCTPSRFPRLRSYHCDHLILPPSPLPPLNLSRILQLPADARRENKMAWEEAEEVYRRRGPAGRTAWVMQMLEEGAGERECSRSYRPGVEVGFEREDWYGGGQRKEWERRREEEGGWGGGRWG